MNQPRFTPRKLRLRATACSHTLMLLGVSFCAVACGNRYEIGDIAAKQAPQHSDGSSNALSTTAAVSAVPRTILTDAYDIDATVAEPEAPDWEPTIVPLGDVDGDGYRDWAECGFKPIEGRVTKQIVYGAPRLPRVISTATVSPISC